MRFTLISISENGEQIIEMGFRNSNEVITHLKNRLVFKVKYLWFIIIETANDGALRIYRYTPTGAKLSVAKNSLLEGSF